MPEETKSHYISWTTKHPKMQGWYWWKGFKWSRPTIAYVVNGVVEGLYDYSKNVTDIDGYWAGPIPFPEE